MDTYGQYCPVARATEILADRWTPLIIRELLAGSHGFNELERGLPGISRALLSERLRRLAHVGIVQRREAGDGQAAGYYLTPAGGELKPVIDALGAWGARWAFGDPRADELDPGLLLWRIRRRVNNALLPARRVVVRFEFRGVRKPHILWLVLQPDDVSVCATDPGFDTEMIVSADLATFYKVWLGRMSLREAVDEELIHIDGSPNLVRAFPRWLQWSPFHDAVRSAALRESPKASNRSA